MEEQILFRLGSISLGKISNKFESFCSLCQG